MLLIAGDLFDTNTPGNACAGMYYDFLTRVRRESGCRRVVITGGNHDSPSFLNAPRGLLDAAFDIKVFGEAAEDPADEVVPVPDDAGVPALIVLAVTRYMSVASLLFVTIFPLCTLVFYLGQPHGLEIFLLSLFFTVMIYWRHRSNIQRLMAGTERKMGQKVVIRQEDQT